MSTYTDLHNRIKENLTILRKPGSKDDGMSPQKVILINPENLFYGTFNGKMNITGGTLSDLNIVGGTIKDTDVTGAKFTVDGRGQVDLGEVINTVYTNEDRIEKLEDDTETISAAHDLLSSELSIAIDSLSADINTKLDEAVDEIKKSISGVVGDVETISSNLDELSVKVETLSTSMLNGIVYKGLLLLKQDTYTSPGQVLLPNSWPCCILDKAHAQDKYTNGWMYRIVLDHSTGNIPLSSLYVKILNLSSAQDPNKVLYLGDGDFIIIKNHEDGIYHVELGSMTLEDIEVINAQDEDDSKMSALYDLSAEVFTAIDDALVSAKTYAEAYTDAEVFKLENLIDETSCNVLDMSREYADRISTEISSTVLKNLTDLSDLLSSYSDKLCAELSAETNASYVHKAGDSILWLDVEEDLSVAGSTTIRGPVTIEDDFEEASGTRASISENEVTIETFAPVMVSSSTGITIASHELSVNAVHGISVDVERGIDDINVNGKSLRDEFNDIIDAANFVLSDDIEFEYDRSSNNLRLTVQGSQLDVDVALLFKGKIVKSVEVQERDGLKFLVITFQVGDEDDPSKIDVVEILINDLFDPYRSGNGIEVDDNLCIHLSEAYRTLISNLLNYANLLSGPQGTYIGDIPTLSNEIDALKRNETQELMPAGHLLLDSNDLAQRYLTVGDFLKQELNIEELSVRNNSYFTVLFLLGDIDLSDVITTDDGLSVGDGDLIIVHEHDSSIRSILWSDLSVVDRSTGIGNVYVIKSGISRYDFEAEAKRRADDDNYISSWISSNFANTGADNDLTTTVFNYELSAKKDLSVASNAYVLSDLSVAGSLFVNGAQLEITVKEDAETSSKTTVASTIADEITFTASSDTNPASTIAINNQFIMISGAAVAIDATNSFMMSADGVKVVDATSSQVEILSVLSVETGKAVATVLSVGNLSADLLAARVAKVTENLEASFGLISSLSASSVSVDFRNLIDPTTTSSAYDEHLQLLTDINRKIFIDGISAESLSAIHIGQDEFHLKVVDGTILSNELYVVSNDYINAYGLQLKNLAHPTDLSDATTKQYVDDGISDLSIQLSAEISSLTWKMWNELSIVETDPLRSIDDHSKVSTLISAVIDVRNTMNSMRQMLASLLNI